MLTELRRVREQALANQRLETVGVLAVGIAHSFNNLVSTILAHAELALDDIPEGSPARESLSTIETVARRASEIMRLMMAYADRADPQRVEPIELSTLIRDLVQFLRTSISRATSFKLNLSEVPTIVLANPGQIRQLVVNLTANASEALEGKPGVVTISTSRVRGCGSSAESGPAEPGEGDYVLLEVSDTGCGMTEELQAKIFDPHFSLKSPGRGLGLYAVEGIVRGLGGEIRVKSAPGQGSTFKVWLPFCHGN
jgi:signal transduction histidine kinase